MILADKFTCDVPLEGATFIECTMPAADILDWLTAIGTLGATVVALLFGLLTWLKESNLEKQAEIRRDVDAKVNQKNERRRNQENQFLQVVQMMRTLVQEFPYGPIENQTWFDSQFRSYLRYLSDEDDQAGIADKAKRALQLFSNINTDYSAVTNEDAVLYRGNLWAEQEEIQAYRSVLAMLSAQFETALQYWHRTGDYGDLAELTLKNINEEAYRRYEEIERASNL